MENEMQEDAIAEAKVQAERKQGLLGRFRR
jgi:hypothetical protein